MSTVNAFFTEDHESIREMARDFAEKALMPAAAEVDRTGHFPQELIDEMANMGFFGIKIPEGYGGIGMDTRTYVCVMEEIARGSAVATSYLSGANSLASSPIVLSGSEEQKQKYLPGIADNSAYVAFALTEPNAGSDAGGMSTRAVEDGDSYVLNGRKCFITGAPIAKYCVVFAKTNPEKGAKGISTFMVDMSAPGVSVGKHEEKMGQVGLDCCDVVLEDVRVPKSDLIGEVDMGFITAMKTLSVGRCGVAAQGLGIAQAAIDAAVKHVKERKQFGKPLAAFQGLQFMLAEMETKLNAARLLVYNAAYLLDMKQDATKAASMAKYFATEAAVDIVGKALQMHGGYGYSKEYTIERLYRDVRVLTLYEGTTQVQQMVISGQLLK
ncbi:acyl-CoA dehydrogenase family protein [Intestinimonas butyriciproducens]|uniref:Butyryl-CoA dehydrogenase n=1 Tax=Intestinimonas butyriciproducens TaxID=1297617 RepID=A0A0S2W555_9FIRM|nr:acyl-CoA dehydrogenase family protein [Intestinimonas butyriciproducens]ALP94263.1 Butyryl-CoA dehydrogenase [Intestinimonas butyriciproducens]